MKTLGIIGARAGSKRVKGKNTRLLGEKPLVCWAIKAAMAASELDCLVVSSDDEHVLELAAQEDTSLPLLRPSEFATDTSPAIEYVLHALAVTESQSSERFEQVVIIQPSSPFTTSDDIDDSIRHLKETGADSVVTVMQLDHAIHPVKLKTLEGDRLLPYLEEENGRMAAHELPDLYVRNCSVYATRRHVIESNIIVGRDCRAIVMPQERSIDINSELDFKFAEFMLSEKNKSEA